MKHAVALLFVLGLLTGFGLLAGVVAALLVLVAQNSGAGHQSRHIEAAKGRGR